MNQHKTYIETIGPKGHRRCRIAGEQGFWNGEDWSDDPRHVLLYLDFQQAARDLQLVQLYENCDMPCTTYRATVTVNVIGEPPEMGVAELQEYLANATKLALTKPAPNGEVVLIDLDWDKLEMTEQTEGGFDV